MHACKSVCMQVHIWQDPKISTPKIGSQNQDLRQALELEINLEFGARHEEAAIEIYEARLGKKVYGQQHRVSVGMPPDGPKFALSHCFPPPYLGARPQGDVNSDQDNWKWERSHLPGSKEKP